jgi:hypothetical protein
MAVNIWVDAPADLLCEALDDLLLRTAKWPEGFDVMRVYPVLNEAKRRIRQVPVMESQLQDGAIRERLNQEHFEAILEAEHGRE